MMTRRPDACRAHGREIAPTLPHRPRTGMS
jgi:hypothetical protein